MPVKNFEDGRLMPVDELDSGARDRQAREYARSAAGQAKAGATAQVDRGSTQLGKTIGAQAQSLHGVAEELRRQGKGGPATIAEQAEQRVADVGRYLEQTDGESLLGAIEGAARENPGAAAAAVGFAAGRLLKACKAGPASASREHPAEGG